MVLATAALVAALSVTTGTAWSHGADPPLPAPNGHGPVALLVGGRFGPANTLALDAKGRTLAYGLGSETVSAFSVCPDGRRVAVITDLDRGASVAIREVDTMRLVRRQRLGSVYSGARPHCASADGVQLVAFFGSGPDFDKTAQVVRFTPHGTATIWRGLAWNATFWRNLTFVQDGASIVAVDAHTGLAKKLGTVPVAGAYQLVANPAGTRLVGESYNEGLACCPRLLVIDLKSSPIRLHQMPHPGTVIGADGQEVWVSNDRFAFLGSAPKVTIYSATLRALTRFGRWNVSSSTVALRSNLLGLRANGTLVAAGLPSGPVRVVRRLPGHADVIAAAAR